MEILFYGCATLCGLYFFSDFSLPREHAHAQTTTQKPDPADIPDIPTFAHTQHRGVEVEGLLDYDFYKTRCWRAEAWARGVVTCSKGYSQQTSGT